MTDDKEVAQQRLDIANWRLKNLEPGTPAFKDAVSELAAALADARKAGLIPTEEPSGE